MMPGERPSDFQTEGLFVVLTSWIFMAIKTSDAIVLSVPLRFRQ
jgi:hypothetical protein